jgi:hypothetical protein
MRRDQRADRSRELSLVVDIPGVEMPKTVLAIVVT